jgi:hypothetical protein
MIEKIDAPTANPTVRIHQSSPSPQDHQTQSMIAQQSPSWGGGWNNFQGAYLSAVPQTVRNQTHHKRASSGSSITSGGPPSPLSHNTLHPTIATDQTYSPSYHHFEDYHAPQTAKSLPPTYDMSGLFNQVNGYQSVDMRRIQSTGADERASYTLSAPQSVSTMSHPSPATPHTNYEPEYEDQKVYGEKVSDDDMSHYLHFSGGGYPSAVYQQSLQDVFPDQQFTYQQQPMQRIPPNHRQTMMADRLQAAHVDHLRTNSPTACIAAEATDVSLAERIDAGRKRSGRPEPNASVPRATSAADFPQKPIEYVQLLHTRFQQRTERPDTAAVSIRQPAVTRRLKIRHP